MGVAGIRFTLPGHDREVACAFPEVRGLEQSPIESVQIPYEGTVLPGYFLRPDAGGRRRPTIIIGDNASEELYYWVGPPAMERGYNALLVDLPGIGLREPFSEQVGNAYCYSAAW
jgi:hypothetical protein